MGITSISRSKTPRVSRITPREWLVAASGGLTLAYTAWGLGGIPAWSLHMLLAGGLTTLTLALCPLLRREQGAGSREQGADSVAERGTRFDPQRTEGNQNSPLSTLHFPLQSLKRLARWPAFYLSLAYLIYLLIGALNPAAQVVADERGWWVEAIQPRFSVWLPTSVLSDYQPMNAWRAFNMHLAAFTLAWGLYAGLTRRTTTLCVLWVFLLSGCGMAFVAILQHLTGAEKVLWSFASANKEFWGSFFYRNQGGAYLNVILIAAGILYFYHVRRCRLQGQSGGPHFMAFVAFLLVAASVALSLSRGSTLITAGLSVSFIGLLVLQQIILAVRVGHTPVLQLLFVVVCLIGGFFVYRSIDVPALEERFTSSTSGSSMKSRSLARQATIDMAQARIWQGWGAGSFRYVFPMYQSNYPDIFFRTHVKHGYFGRLHWRYAHNDLLQFLAEYGVVGSALLWLAVGALLFSQFWHSSQNLSSACFVLLAAAGMAVHAFFDFILSSPAVWISLIALLSLIPGLSQGGRSGKPAH